MTPHHRLHSPQTLGCIRILEGPPPNHPNVPSSTDKGGGDWPLHSLCPSEPQLLQPLGEHGQVRLSALCPCPCHTVGKDWGSLSKSPQFHGGCLSWVLFLGGQRSFALLFGLSQVVRLAPASSELDLVTHHQCERRQAGGQGSCISSTPASCLASTRSWQASEVYPWRGLGRSAKPVGYTDAPTQLCLGHVLIPVPQSHT